MQNTSPETSTVQVETAPIIDMAKVDRDLFTMGFLQTMLQEEDFAIGFAGGYAADAQLGDEVRRDHEDIDGYIYLEGQDPGEAKALVRQILNHEANSRWEETPDPSPTGLHFIDHSVSSALRKVDLRFGNQPKRVDLRRLKDSKGYWHDLNVREPSVLIGNKVILLTKQKKFNLREIKDSDLEDLRALAALPGFSELDCIEAMTEDIFSFRGVDRDEARLKAIEEWETIEAEVKPEIKPES